MVTAHMTIQKTLLSSMPPWNSYSLLRDSMYPLFRQNTALLLTFQLCLFLVDVIYLNLFFYSWVYQLDIYLVIVFFMSNVQMFNIEKKKQKKLHNQYDLIQFISVVKVLSGTATGGRVRTYFQKCVLPSPSPKPYIEFWSSRLI